MNTYNSTLHDEKTFYQAFIKDLEKCQEEVIIESPFITSKRMKTLSPIFNKLYNRGIKIYIITRDPKEHNEGYEIQSENEIEAFETTGIQVLLCTGNHHRKLAIIDRKVLWEGSLNILSQIRSREIMRRLEGDGFARDMFKFLNFGRYI
ncbi:MAG: phospholipase D-like domain-containing protein [Candidatus Shapirobacteria bacterium]|nr:phospholipase D-like domain-containing protein [Candidatus Shapirobacteria bacterium]MDD3003123.1 phospholipase D-like domain-containing protein [Candidatus Shapirobacteria bacterium]MDD4383185.1 phospholipase D-like domain-containing protein [Candidatus Shapirobacteria bacterium]